MNIQRLVEARACREPFPHLTVDGLLMADELGAVSRDFPAFREAGLFPLSALSYGPAFERLVDELRSRAFGDAIGEKLGLDLSGLPLMITVRGRCAARDGRPHTDSKDKVATGLLYLNQQHWSEAGGRLRLLGGRDLSDIVAEVAPVGGTLVAFRRTDNSWHGHQPYEGERRYVMFNWLRSCAALGKNVARHRLSSQVKRMAAAYAG